MKPALVLGLALAANAMATDSELFGFAVPQGKLGELARKYPGMIMYDEVADDELAVALAPRSVFKSDEEYKKYVYSMRHSWDDAADDELAVMLLPRDRFKTEEEYQKYYNRARFTLDDAADDELWAGIGADGKGTLQTGPLRFDPKQWKLTPEQLKMMREQANFTPKQFSKLVADDELALMLAPRSRFNSDEEYEKYKIRMRRHYDDAADDELFFNPPEFLSRNPTDVYGRILRDSRGLPIQPIPARFDEVADDELAAVIAPRSRFNSDEEYEKYKIRMRRSFDDAADDELSVVGRVKSRSEFSSDEEYQKYRTYRRMHPNFDDAADDELAINQQIAQLSAEHVAFDDDELMRGIPPVENFKSYEDWLRFTRKMSEETDNELRIRPISVLPTAEPVAFDDELSIIQIPPKVFVNRDWVKPTRIPVSEALIRDDEADDELAYLGHLLNERAQPRSFDEFKTGKLSHGKTKEKTQTKKKLRPIVDETPLSQN